MKFTDNYNLNLPDLADQYNLEHWNANTSKIDEQLKFCENNIENLQQEHQDDATAMNTAILKNTIDIATETTERKTANENLQRQIDLFGVLERQNFFIGDNGSADFTLQNGNVCLFINTHFRNFGEVVMLTYFSDVGVLTKVISSPTTSTIITHKGNGVVNFKSPGECRGYLYLLKNIKSI